MLVKSNHALHSFQSTRATRQSMGYNGAMEKIAKPKKTTKTGGVLCGQEAKSRATKQNQPKKHAGKTKAIVQARRKKIIRAITEGKTQKEAGVEAGLNPKNAESQVCNILKEPQVKRTFLEILNETIPDDFHSNVYREGMEANKVISANVIAPNGEGMADDHSMTKDFIEVPDHPTRIKAADSVSKLKGLIVDKSQHGLDERVLSILCSILPSEYVQEFKKKLSELLQADKK